MGQKSNLQTLRLKNRYNINAIGLLPKEAINSISFIESLKTSLNRKQIYLIDSNFNLRNNTGNLSLTVFYKSKWFVIKKRQLMGFYAKRCEINKKNRLFRNKKKILKVNKKNTESMDNDFFPQLFINSLITNNRLFNKLLENKNLILEITNLNHQFDSKAQELKKELITLCLPFRNKLFSRREYLYNDLLKMSILLLMNKMKLSTYVTILAQVFRILPKRLHNIFYKLIETLFDFLDTTEDSNVKGIRLLINGKLKGRSRSSTVNFSYGKIERQTLSANVDYAKTPIFTVYGTYGFHMWVNFYDNDDILEDKQENDQDKKENIIIEDIKSNEVDLEDINIMFEDELYGDEKFTLCENQRLI
jgi:hypothetical protein